MFKFLNTTQVCEFAETIVADYDRMRRSALMRGDNKEKLRQRREKLLQRVDQYCCEQRPNFYKKAKMIRAIQSGMETKVIPSAEVAAFVDEAMIIRLKRAP